MIRRVLSFLRYAFWPGRTIAFQALGGAGASGLLLGLLAAWFGSKWAGVAMFVMTFLAVVFFSAGLRLYLTIDQRPRIVLGDPYVRPIQLAVPRHRRDGSLAEHRGAGQGRTSRTERWDEWRAGHGVMFATETDNL